MTAEILLARAIDMHRSKPAEIIGHTERDGTWFEWQGPVDGVVQVSLDLWTHHGISAWNEARELPWYLQIIAEDPERDRLYVVRLCDNEGNP